MQRRWQVLTLVSVATFVASLVLFIVNIAFSDIRAEFGGTSVGALSWVLNAYAIVFAALLVPAGRLADRTGRKRGFLAGLALFSLGSALCGAAPSVETLVAARVLQAAGAALLVPTSLALLLPEFEPRERPAAIGIWAGVGAAAAAAGPPLGGLLVQVDWRLVFLVNLPVGAVAIALAHRLLPDAHPQLGQRLDLRGLALLSPGIALFLYGVSEAGGEGGFSSARTIVPTLLGLALVAGFVPHAIRRGKDALIDLTLFTRRGFAVGATTNFVLGLALFGALILLPLYYQLVRRESPLDTGLLLAPQGLGAAVAMPLAGWLTDRHGARLVVPVGMVIALVGTLAFLTVTEDTSYALLSGALFLIGAGLGSTIMPSMAVAFGSISKDAVPRASSALNTIQRIAGAIGTALFAIVLQRQLESGVPSLQGGIEELAGLGPAAQARIAPALADAFGQTFRIAVALILVALVPALMLPKTGGTEAEPAAEAPAERRAA